MIFSPEKDLVFIDNNAKPIRVWPELITEANTRGWKIAAVQPKPEETPINRSLAKCADCKKPFISRSPIGNDRCPSCTVGEELKSRQIAQQFKSTQGDGFWCG